MKKNKVGRPTKDIVGELLAKPIVEDFSTEKITNAWGEVIPIQPEDIVDELDRMEGFNTHTRYNSDEAEFEFMGDNNY